MTPTAIMIIIGVCTFVLSVGTSALVVGIAWGRLTQTMTTLGKDVAEIKGMFRLTPKE